MNKSELNRWSRKLKHKEGKPVYRLIADLISADIDSGRLKPGDRLPALRELAKATFINYTTAARAYTEAKNRGLIDSQPGAGTFVRGKTATIRPSLGHHEMTMNSPIEPAIPTLVEQIRDSAISALARHDLYSLLRYQAFGGTRENKESAHIWLENYLDSPCIERILICPGIHTALVGLVSTLIEKHQVLCVESTTYPGIKSIAAQLGIQLFSLERDNDGPIVHSFVDACKLGHVGALYLNPTIQNPTTTTITQQRREALAEACLHYSVPIIEDDAYGPLANSTLSTFCSLAPDLTWYITGTSKCFGPGLRSAFVYSPGARQSQRFSAAMRALHVMSSPITDALVSQWILDGTANQMLKSIRREAIFRTRIAEEILDKKIFRVAEGGFHLWLSTPRGPEWNPSELAIELRQRGISAVSSSAFCTNNNPENAIRLCFGGPITQDQWRDQLLQISDILQQPGFLASGLH